MVIHTKAAIDFLNKQLQLPYKRKKQDWHIKMADSNRVLEFITYMQTTVLTDEQKFALMSLIIASYDDLLWNNFQPYNNYWNDIAEIIKEDKPLYLPLIEYWSQDARGDGYPISTRMNQLMNYHL